MRRPVARLDMSTPAPVPVPAKPSRPMVTFAAWA
jgi:hypothetical protein